MEDVVENPEDAKQWTALLQTVLSRVVTTAQQHKIGRVLLVQQFEEGDVMRVWAAWKHFAPGTVLLSFAYAEEEDSSGNYSQQVELHVDGRVFSSTIPASARFMMVETRKLLGEIEFWCDRINTIPFLGGTVSEQQRQDHQAMISSMGAMYWQGLTISEILFRRNDAYLERGWVMQEILNGAVLVEVATVRSPDQQVLDVLRHAAYSEASWVLAVALNHGADKARAIPHSDDLYAVTSLDAAGGVGGRLSEAHLSAAVAYAASLRDVVLGRRSEPVCVLEVSFLFSFLLHAGPDVRVCVPVGHSLTLAWQRGKSDARTGVFAPRSLAIQELPPRTEAWRLGLLAPKGEADLQDLHEYNARNLFARFSFEADRPVALYRLLETVLARPVHANDKRHFGLAWRKRLLATGHMPIVNRAASALDVLVDWRRHFRGWEDQADAREPLGPREVAVVRSLWAVFVATGAGVSVAGTEGVLAVAAQGPDVAWSMTGLDAWTTAREGGIVSADAAAIFRLWPGELERFQIRIADLDSGRQALLGRDGGRAAAAAVSVSENTAG